MLRDASRGTHPDPAPRAQDAERAQVLEPALASADHQRGKNSERINSILEQAISVAPDQLSSLLGSCRRVRNMLFRRRLRLRKLAAEKIAHLLESVGKSAAFPLLVKGYLFKVKQIQRCVCPHTALSTV